MRVLVVEDEVKMAGLLKRGLEEEGYAVDVARDRRRGAVGRDREPVRRRSCSTSCFPTSTGSRSAAGCGRAAVGAGPDAHRARRRARPRRRPGRGRRRLPHQAVLLHASCSHASARSCGAAPSERPAVLQAGDLALDPATRRVDARGARRSS